MLLVYGDVARAREIRGLLKPLGCLLRIAKGASEAERFLREEPSVSLAMLGADSLDHDPIVLGRRLRTVAGCDALPLLFLTDPETCPFDVEAAYALGSVDDVSRPRLDRVLAAKVRFLLASDARAQIRTARELRHRVDALDTSNRRKDDFLATLAHELRAPLAPIRNGLELMRLGGNDPAELEAVREMMSRQLDQLAYLVDDLLDVARSTRNEITLKKERVDLRTILATALETVRPLLEEKEHALTLDLRAEALPVEADPVRMAQVIGNLLSNAVKYTPVRGHVRVIADVVGAEVLLCVEDDGIGIPTEALPRIFDMFNRVPRSASSVEGLGVGLALVARLLHLHDGSIEASSTGPGLGSTFRVHLPLSSASASASAETRAVATAVEPTSVSARFRILVVEDDADAGATLSKILQRERQVTRVASGGAEALRIAATFRPEIVLLDIGLPDIGGHELAPRLRALDATNAPVIVAMTGYASEADRARSRAAGIDRHLVKPTRIATLRQLLADVAEGFHGSGGGADGAEPSRAPAGFAAVDSGRDGSMPTTRAFFRDCIGGRTVAMSVADARLPDQPLVLVNRAFTDLTGYPEADVVGNNCRFLQGRNRDQEGVRRLAEAIRDGRDVEVFLHNYTRAGTPFVNLLRLYMLRDASGTVRFIFGSQLGAAAAELGGASVASEANAALDIATDVVADDYPALLPDRYRSLYTAEGAIADEVAVRLAAHVASLP